MGTLTITRVTASTDATAAQFNNMATAVEAAVNALDANNWASGQIFAPSKLTQESATDGQVLTWDTGGSKWQPEGGAWTAFVPALTATVTNPTLGTGSSAAGRYVQIGKLVVAQAKIAFGTSGTNAGSGDYRVSLPVNPQANTHVCGNFLAYDNGGASYRAGVLQDVASGLTALLVLGGGNLVTAAAPWAWDAADEIDYSLSYEAA